MANASKVLVERSGFVTTIIRKRLKRRNAVDGETALLFRAAFQAF